MSTTDEYAARVSSEVDHYADVTVVHDLPDIFHYWSNKYVLPKLQALGFDSAESLFTTPLTDLCQRHPQTKLRFLSIGAGNCDFELGIAKTLTAAGHTNFLIDCLDINPSMLERGIEAATEASLSAHLAPLQGDFNNWEAAYEYDAVLAVHSLHHVVNLEGLFAQITASLKPHGRFITSDMIGRNGHERWPEALEAVQHFWHQLPPSYRYNRQLRRYENTFQDWNCVADCFEGIRAQDILPLLLEHFHFEKFAGFANVIDPFVDRGFGPNFHAERDFDRAFIDEVHAFDEQNLRAGALSPTHMFAVLTKTPPPNTTWADGLAPERAVRRESCSPLALPEGRRRPISEQEAELGGIVLILESDRQRLETQVMELHEDLITRTAWAQGLEEERAKNANWAGSLEKHNAELAGHIRRLESELEDLHQNLVARTSWARGLEQERDERTAWATRLDKHNAELTERLRALQSEPPVDVSLSEKLKRLFRRH